jgi:broad specificity phosphatase PhoE
MTKNFFKYWLIIGSLVLSLSSCYTSKIYIVRHAERLDQSADTPLSAAGHQRAKDLAEKLGKENIDSIFVSNYQRTRQTAQPLADV